MANLTLVIGNKAYSSWSLRAWICLRHSGLDFNEIRLPLYTEVYQNKIFQYSPTGKVPVLIENNTAVWESIAICETLAEKTPSLIPSDPKARMTVRAISAEMHAGFSAIREALPFNCRAKNRKVAIKSNVTEEINRVFDIWTECLNNENRAGKWLFGEYSIADAMYAPLVSRFITYGIEAPQETVGEYMNTVINDAAFQEWMAEASSETETIEAAEVGLI